MIQACDQAQQISASLEICIWEAIYIDMSRPKSKYVLPEHAPGIRQDLSHHGNVLSILINLGQAR